VAWTHSSCLARKSLRWRGSGTGARRESGGLLFRPYKPSVPVSNTLNSNPCCCTCSFTHSYVLKKPEYAPPKVPQQQLDPLQLLDYRCHSPGGKLGTAYPKPVRWFVLKNCVGGRQPGQSGGSGRQ
jgi:hypothetical protein